MSSRSLKTTHLHWRHQDLLRAGAEIEIMSIIGHVHVVTMDSRPPGPEAAATNAVLIERAELLTSASANLADYTMDSWLRDLLQSEVKMKLL